MTSYNTLCVFSFFFLPDFSESVGLLLQNDARGSDVWNSSPESVESPEFRGFPGIPGSGVTKCGSDVSFHVRPLVRMTGV